MALLAVLHGVADHTDRTRDLVHAGTIEPFSLPIASSNNQLLYEKDLLESSDATFLIRLVIILFRAYLNL